MKFLNRLFRFLSLLFVTFVISYFVAITVAVPGSVISSPMVVLIAMLGSFAAWFHRPASLAGWVLWTSILFWQIMATVFDWSWAFWKYIGIQLQIPQNGLFNATLGSRELILGGMVLWAILWGLSHRYHKD